MSMSIAPSVLSPQSSVCKPRIFRLPFGSGVIACAGVGHMWQSRVEIKYLFCRVFRSHHCIQSAIHVYHRTGFNCDNCKLRVCIEHAKLRTQYALHIIHLCNNTIVKCTICLASFPDSTPQLFIALCIKAFIHSAIKSWGVESGNEATICLQNLTTQ